MVAGIILTFRVEYSSVRISSFGVDTAMSDVLGQQNLS